MPPAVPPPAEAPARPASLRDLFWSFTFLALQGFGGVLAIAQRELVDRKQWLTREQFVEDWSVAQILPGPNIVNLSLMFGGRHFGLKGALTAMAGLLSLPLCVLLLLGALYAGAASHPAAQGALRGMSAVAAGLIAGAGIRLIGALGSNVMGRIACGVFGLATFVCIAILHVPLLGVLLGLGGTACAWAWSRLRPAGGGSAP